MHNPTGRASSMLRLRPRLRPHARLLSTGSSWSTFIERLPLPLEPIGNLLRGSQPARAGEAASARRVLTYEQTLPMGLPPPEEEFKRDDQQQSSDLAVEMQRFSRLSLSLYQSPELRAAVGALGVSVLAVYGIGLGESVSTLSADFCSEHPLQALRYAHQYALEQILPSAICMPAKPSSSVALHLGLEPSVALAEPFRSTGALPYDYAHTCSSTDASLILRQQGFAATRCTLATLAMLSMIVRTVTLSIRAAQELKERIRAGREPLLTGVKGRVIRLCGRSSDVTALSLARYGLHIVPVYERPSEVEELIQHHSGGFRVPVYWQVSEGAYGQMTSWSPFRISPDFFLRTTTGRRLLYLEADTTNRERSLSLRARSEDLTMEDASQAFRLVEAAARQMLDVAPSGVAHSSSTAAAGTAASAATTPPAKPRPLRTLRVVLGDPRQTVSSGARRRDLRTRIVKLGEADVLIDSQASVVEAVLRWCAHVGVPPRGGGGGGDGGGGGTVRGTPALRREAAHLAAEEVAEAAEVVAEHAVARAQTKARAAKRAAREAEDEQAIAIAVVEEEKRSGGATIRGNSLAADTAVSAVVSTQKAAKAAIDAVEAQLRAKLAEAREAVAWTEASKLPERTIVFETDSPTYCAELQALLRSFDVAVLTEVEAERLEAELGDATSAEAEVREAAEAEVRQAAAAAAQRLAEAEAGEAGAATVAAAEQAVARVAAIEAELAGVRAAGGSWRRLPRLVYFASTSETANAAQSLIQSGVADPSRCCAILDEHEGVDMLRVFMRAGGGGGWRGSSGGEIEVVDCSVIYDDLFRQCRVWARLGHSAPEIQAELDARFRPISEVLNGMVELHRGGVGEG